MRVKLESMRTLRQAQRELRCNWKTLVKIMSKLGIVPKRVGRIALLTEEEFKAVKEAHERIARPRKAKSEE